MKKKTAVLTISYLLAAVLLMGVFGFTQLKRAETAERALRYEGQRAFSELCEAVQGMDAALEKSLYALSPGVTTALCAEVYSRALSASAALGTLPFSTQELAETAAFLSRTGDYACWLLRRTGGGESAGEEELENLRALSDAAALLCDNLTRLGGELTDGTVSADTVKAAEAGLPELSDSFLSMENEFPELPSLVYDGPFSASIADRVPRMTDGANEIDENAAMLVAAGFLGVQPNRVSSEGSREGKLPVWVLSGEGYTVSVSKQGGYVVKAIAERSPQRSAITVEAALRKAEEFLRARRYFSMRESYHVQEGNILTVTYCYLQGDVLCYPDMVKLSVALDTGEILRFDAEAYLTSHTKRELAAPKVSVEEARALVAPTLKIVSEGLAVIPSAGEEELFCREYICENEEGRHYLVYVNAVTGVQERILILLEDETGTLAL